MSRTVTPREDAALALLARIDAVEARLAAHADRGPATGLTSPDPPSGERWDWGQVWAHLGEFIPYWVGQVRLILRRPGPEPVPFGRTKADPVRIAAIEADRSREPRELMERLRGHLRELRALVGELSAEEWGRTGHHSTLGVMTMPRIFSEFLVGHLESHADQLDDLAYTGGPAIRSNVEPRREVSK